MCTDHFFIVYSLHVCARKRFKKILKVKKKKKYICTVVKHEKKTCVVSVGLRSFCLS